MRALVNLHNGLVEVSDATAVARRDVQEMLRSAGSVDSVTQSLITMVRESEIAGSALTEATVVYQESVKGIEAVVEAGLVGVDQLASAQTGIIGNLHQIDTAFGPQFDEYRRKLNQLDPREKSREIHQLIADLNSADSAAAKIDGVLGLLKDKSDPISKQLEGIVEQVKSGDLAAEDFLARVRQMKAAADRFNPNSAFGSLLEFLEQTVASADTRNQGITGGGIDTGFLGGGSPL